MKLIIETDIGRDPDDLWAILYLISTGIDVQAITISPGYRDQIALTQFIREYLQLDFQIGSSSMDQQKKTITPYHAEILEHHNAVLTRNADDYGDKIIENVISKTPQVEFLLIGPILNFGRFIKNNADTVIHKVTMQGGFIGYDVHGLPVRRLKRFIDRTTFPTFNLNCSGDFATDLLQANIKSRTFVGKHLCHSVVLDKASHELIMRNDPKSKAMELFQYSVALYFKNYSGGKKFHDPVAAVSHTHPEITTKVKATLYKKKDEWGAYMDVNGDDIVVDINRNKFWEYVSKCI